MSQKGAFDIAAIEQANATRRVRDIQDQFGGQWVYYPNQVQPVSQQVWYQTSADRFREAEEEFVIESSVGPITSGKLWTESPEPEYKTKDSNTLWWLAVALMGIATITVWTL